MEKIRERARERKQNRLEIQVNSKMLEKMVLISFRKNTSKHIFWNNCIIPSSEPKQQFLKRCFLCLSQVMIVKSSCLLKLKFG